jgi:hypothetical protein
VGVGGRIRDTSIAGIRPLSQGTQALNNDELFAHESNGETNRNESFADDSNNFIMMDLRSLSKLKNILHNFKILSGLECNVNKSFIMRIGDLEGGIDQSILDLGFPFTNSITILGFVINNDGTCVEKNFEKIQNKILNIVRFWEQFNLSLPGKIAIYKTLLLPQLNFISSVFRPADDTLTEIGNVMDDFVTKGLNISKKRLHVSVQRGGLGLFDIRNFITALQCSWIKRALTNTNDNWKVTLKSLGEGNVLDCDKTILNNHSIGLGLSNIIASFSTFKKSFFQYKNNFLHDRLYKNDLYGTGRAQMFKFDETFFGPDIINTYGNILGGLKWLDCTVNGNFVSFDEFSYKTGLVLPLVKLTN